MVGAHASGRVCLSPLGIPLIIIAPGGDDGDGANIVMMVLMQAMMVVILQCSSRISVVAVTANVSNSV